MMKPHTTPDDRGISEVVAFTLTFSLIIGTTAILFSGGILALNDLRLSEQVNAADQSMEQMASIHRSLHEGDTPQRSLEVGLSGGRVELRDSTIDVTVTNDSGDTPYSESVNVGSFEYLLERGETVISVENGVLFRRDGGTLMRTRPLVRCTDDVAVVSVLELDGSVSVAGDGSVETSVRRVRGGLAYPDDVANHSASDGAKVTVDVRNSRNEDGWRQFFQDSELAWAGTGTDGVYECSGVNRVYVYKTTLAISTT